MVPHQMQQPATALTALLERLAHNALALLGVTSVSLALLDADTGDLVTLVALGATGEYTAPERFRPNEGIEGWVAAHLEPVMMLEGSRDTRFAFRAPQGVRSLICVPLIDEAVLLGTLTMASPDGHIFDERRLQLLDIFADQAVLAISKTLQAEANATQARELSALLDASRALTSTLDPVHVFNYIVASIRKVVSCEDAIIYIHDEHSQSLRVATGIGSRIDRLGGAQIAFDDPHSVAALVARERRASMTRPRDGQVGALTEAFLAGEELALLCVPLISKDSLRGVVMLARSESYKAADLRIMINLSGVIAAALENVALYQDARAEREQQAAVFASASDGIAVIDDNLTFVEVNESMARLIGLTPDEMLDQDACAVLQRHSTEGCGLCTGNCLLARSLESGADTRHIECEYVHVERLRQGTGHTTGGRLPRRYIDFSVTPIGGEGERRVLLVGRDVTAAREMEQMKSNFIAMVSHELRSPLQTISGYLDLTLSGMGGAVTEQQHDFLRRAKAGSEHLTTLVDDLLLISRRDAGEYSLQRREIDLAPVIQETVEELELFAEDGGIQLSLSVPSSLPSIFADRQRISQVIRNRVTNAVKFTPPSGQVTVSADVQRDSIILKVRDTGVGISKEHQERIFERFYQVSTASTHGRFQGQGLGLAIVRIIVEGHGGSIDVDSAPQRGSTFTITLPRSGGAEV